MSMSRPLSNTSTRPVKRSIATLCRIDAWTNLDAFGARIRELRRQRGLTQQQLADAIEIGRSTLAGVELGRDQLGIGATIDLADYFEVSLDWLIGRQVPHGGDALLVHDREEIALIQWWRRQPVEKRPAMAVTAFAQNAA